MAEPAEKISLISSDSDQTATIRIPRQDFRDRESKELVIGLVGPVGSAVNLVADAIDAQLIRLGYDVVRIKLSQLIIKISKIEFPDETSNLDHSLRTKERYTELQEAGNLLRGRFGNDILSELAITKIAKTREDSIPEGVEPEGYIPEKRAYIIDQLKHPDEVEMLRTVYGNLFLLIGVFASTEQRVGNLVSSLQLNEGEAMAIMEKDRKDNEDHGQQLDQALKLADLFIRNSNGQGDRLNRQLDRFFKILHGEVGITPTQHEYGMYAAYSSGLKSACLSRQVGAAITDSHGNLLATGCNDVPRAGGGLYTSQSENDGRCYNKEGGKCFNSHHKEILKNDILTVIREFDLDIEDPKSLELAEKIKSDTGLKDLLEFSRSVHAEMDAITTVARTGAGSTRDSYLYTTTYPCHNCARHIIAAGIKKVYYIEPYTKSLAKVLHRDAIEIDPEEENEALNHVQFLHFEGISPRQYQNFFYPKLERKTDNGLSRVNDPTKENKIVAQLLDDYRSLEDKIFQILTEEQHISEDIFTD